MHHNIRLANYKDFYAVKEIVRSAYSHYVVRIGRAPGPLLDDYASLIANRYVHIIEQDGVLQGILVLIPESDAMLLDNVAVAPSAQGLGLGRKMLEFAELTARGAGFNLIRLYTNEAMTETIKLYCRIGYCETHRATENGLRRVYMTKSLY